MIKEAIFAMGCFWCGESEFRNHDDPSHLKKGITSVEVGYAGGTKPHPTYHDHEGYKEAVKVSYNPDEISYEELLNIFWHNVDPYDADGQFCDKGYPYTAVIYVKDQQEEDLAKKTKADVEKKLGGKPIVVEIVRQSTFVKAEEYHQDYRSKNPVRYKYYRWSCGRDKRLQEIWLGHNE